MKRLALMLACLFMSMGLAIAQNKTVSGNVFDEDGETVIGASVLAKGTTIGTATDINGRFSLTVPESVNTLVVQFIGYHSVEVAASTNVRVVLVTDSKMLEEVVISTGYGNFAKSSFTGAASTIGLGDVADTPSESLLSLLSGAVSGIKVTSNAGQPGGYTSMRVRGSGSLTGNNNPLYVIDGVPVFTGDISEFTYAQSGTDPIAMINPNDIESITVIKDAAAASLYGSRAANGVILITTKSGKAGKPVVSLKADWGFSDFAIDWRPNWDGDTRREIQKLGFQNYFMNLGQDAATALQNAENQLNSSSQSIYSNKPEDGWVDWKDLLLRKNPAHRNYEFSIRGGEGKTTYFASLGYLDSEGIQLQSQFERYTGRVGVTHQSDRWLLDGNASISKSVQNRSNEGTSYGSPIMAVFGISGSPAYNPFDPDQSDGFAQTGFPLGGAANPLASATYNANNANLFRSQGIMKIGYRVWDKLVLSQRLGYDDLRNKEIVWWDSRSNDGRGYNGLNQTMITEHQTLSTQSQLTYQKTFESLHDIDALAAFETEGTDFALSYLNGYDFPNTTLRELSSAAETSAETEKEEVRLMSYLGRVNYTYSDKYYLSASFRRDGTSRLSSQSRWGNFGSISGAWRISNESFYPSSLEGILNNAKIRLSYGTNGNLPLERYLYQGVYSFSWKYNGMMGSAEDQVQNNELRWEKQAMTNLGIDLTFINRISVTVDLYNRDNKDLLYTVPISRTTGFSSTWTNISLVNNKGIEVEVKSNNIQKQDFRWITSFNLAYNKNKVKSITDDSDQIISGVSITEVGKPMYSIYAFEYAGVDPATGKESFYVNREGHEREITTDIADADKINLGSVTPDVTGGVTNSFSYKGIDFSFVMTYSLGGQVYDAATWMQTNGGTYNYRANIPTYYVMDDMWSAPGDNAKLPRFVYGNVNTLSSRWLYSTDHLRLKSITLGYTLPSNITNKAGIGKCRFYTSASNLLTFKKSDLYLDPETPISGQVTFQTPPMKTITFGVEFEF